MCLGIFWLKIDKMIADILLLIVIALNKPHY